MEPLQTLYWLKMLTIKVRTYSSSGKKVQSSNSNVVRITRSVHMALKLWKFSVMY